MIKARRTILILLTVMTIMAIPLTAFANTPALGWYKDNAGRWSYNTTNGWSRNGWERIDSQWYLFDSSGYMLTGWQKQAGTWYYLQTSGAMATGWQQIGGVWYHFKSSGTMSVGWVQSGSKWYYMAGSGAMLYSQWIGSYYVGSDGAWIPGYSNSQTSGYVWLAATGSKYHRINNCGSMNPSRAKKISLADAKKQGYTPCNVCNPPK